MTSEGYLDEKPLQKGYGSTIGLSRKANDWMSKNTYSSSPKLTMMPNMELQNTEKETAKPQVSLAFASK